MYKQLIRPVLFCFSAETAHHLTINALRVSKYIPFCNSILKRIFFRKNMINCMGLTFPNRIGLPAGMDKNATVPKAFNALGFGFVEIGTVTPKPQTGNPKPRVFRIKKDNALINRMGFNNDGVEVVAKRLKKYKNRNFILGGNIGKNTLTSNDNAVEDYRIVLEQLYVLVDYIVLNVSCPNIQNLSELQKSENLSSIMKMMINFRNYQSQKKPFVLKISPDLNSKQLSETIDLIKLYKFEGIIVSNTTTKREGLSISTDEITKLGNGGLSGKPMFTNVIALIKEVRQLAGNSITIMGSGGVFNKNDAIAMINAGANLIQIYTGFIYEGVILPKKLSVLQV